EPQYVIHFHSIFEELWKDGTDAKARIASIEEGVDFGEIEVIPSSSRARELYLDIVKNAQNEIMIMLPTVNAFLRQQNMRVGEIAEEAARQRNVKVMILMPQHESTEQLIRSLTIERPPPQYHNFDVRYIEQAMQDTKATVLVVDRHVSLVMEI